MAKRRATRRPEGEPPDPQAAWDAEDLTRAATRHAVCLAMVDALREELAGARAMVRQLVRRLTEAGYELTTAAEMVRRAARKGQPPAPPLDGRAAGG